MRKYVKAVVANMMMMMKLARELGLGVIIQDVGDGITITITVLDLKESQEKVPNSYVTTVSLPPFDSLQHWSPIQPVKFLNYHCSTRF